MDAIAPFARVVAAPPEPDPVLPGPPLLPREEVFNGRDAWQVAVQRHLLTLQCSVLDARRLNATR